MLVLLAIVAVLWWVYSWLRCSAASQPLTCSAPGATTVPPCFAPREAEEDWWR